MFVARLLALLLITAAPAHAVTQQDYDDCNSGNAETRIAGCTRIIEDSQEPARNRGLAYYGRGLGHAQKREYDTAIANFDAAIRLAPSYTPALRVDKHRHSALVGTGLGDWLRTQGIEPRFMTWEERAAQNIE